MSTQADFGVGSSRELVPAGLRGYRYFLPGHRQPLRSFSHRYEWSEGVNAAACGLVRSTGVLPVPGYQYCSSCAPQAGVVADEPDALACADAGKPYRAHTMCLCTRLRRFPIDFYFFDDRLRADDVTTVGVSYGLLPFQVDVTVERLHSTPAPQQSCQCGFYAAYTPEGLVGAPGTYNHSASIVSVVEASGRVLLGTKGFRAEKMRVVAVASLEPDYHKPLYGREWQYFHNLSEMVAAFPPDDVSELLK